jgi:hypothetical protein
MFKLDGSTLTGRSIYLRVATFPAMWRIWGKQGAYQSSTVWVPGDDSGKANCIWTGAHTHRDLQINPGVSFWWGRLLPGRGTVQPVERLLRSRAIGHLE